MITKNQLIASSPLILIVVGLTIFSWIVLGWRFGILLPSALFSGFLIYKWIEYWEAKKK